MANLWIDDGTIVRGLGGATQRSSPTVFDDNGVLKLIAGEKYGTFSGVYWNGSTWVSDSSIVSGLGDIGMYNTPTVFNDSGTLKLISGEYYGRFFGFHWNGSSWISDSSVISGLSDVGTNSDPTVFNDNGTLKLISGKGTGTFSGWYWNGSTWIVDLSIVSGLGDIGLDSAPTVFNDNGTLKLISRGYNVIAGTKSLYSWYWDGSIWISDSSVLLGVSYTQLYGAPIVFDDNGTLKLIFEEYSNVFSGWYWGAFSYNISGHVYNNENIPVKNATVNINETEVLTDENGYYFVTVEPGIYYMEATKECYSKDIATVTATNSDVTQDFIIDCIICKECDPCICPPDKLDWWLLIVGVVGGHILTKKRKEEIV